MIDRASKSALTEGNISNTAFSRRRKTRVQARPTLAATLLIITSVCGFGMPGTAASIRTALTHSQGIAIHAQNESIRAVLLRLSRVAHVSISLAPSVTGFVTVSVQNASLDATLVAILSPLGYTYQRRGGIYMVNGSADMGSPVGGESETVLPVAFLPLRQAAQQLRNLFPDASIRENASSSALIVTAPQASLQALRSVLQGIDVRSPKDRATTAVVLRTLRANVVAHSLRSAFPACTFADVTAQELVISCRPQDSAQVLSTISTLDSPVASPAPVLPSSEVVRALQREPQQIAHAVQEQVPGLRAAVSGSDVVLSGTPDAVARGKALFSSLDVPAFNATYLQVYKIKTLSAASLADLFNRSLQGVQITVETDINALAVTATSAQHQRIADAIAQLDVTAGNGGIGGSAGFQSGTSTEFLTLKSAVPNASGTDIVSTITQSLQVIAPDVHVISLPVTGQLILIGPSSSVRVAREFISKVDVVPRQVRLDTEVFEIDESVAKNLGVQLGTAILSTTYTEATPPPNPSGYTPAFDRLQALGTDPNLVHRRIESRDSKRERPCSRKS